MTAPDTLERSRTHVLAGITVADVMTTGIVSRPRSAPLSEVARLMAEQRIHCVIVADEQAGSGPPLWGVISDLDLVAAATVRGLEDQTAGASAATAVLTVTADESLLRAGQLMTEHATTHLVVVDPVHGAPVGVLSTLDVTGALARTSDRREK
jgi:CBS domain-containing protein